MDAIVTLFALVFAGLIAWVARRVIGSVSPDVPPTNQYEPKPDTGAPEPSPDEDYPLPDQPEPEDPLPLEPELTPEPTPEPEPAPPPPVVVPTPPSDVFTRAEQAAFFKAIGLPYSTDADLKASTVKFQLACTWTDDAGNYIAADGGFGRLTTQVARKCIAADYRISKYFHLYEFRCKGQDAAQGSGAHCIACKIIYIDRNLVMALDLVREQIYQGPLSIVTGYRCDGYNAHVGGVTNSAHRLGLAADIPRKFSWARFTGRGFRGIGKSRVDRVSVVHVDRDTRLRADYVFQE